MISIILALYIIGCKLADKARTKDNDGVHKKVHD